ncbi:MAG: outer membrane protein transport protein [Deltaproteobacteria bacterium]|nr:outer membrane protein transport protein [Deltaproteobacteria bacterium]
MKKLPLLAVLLLSSTLAAQARAAAYYVGEIGARSIARGGANLVNPKDPMAAWLNPAALTNAKGLQLELDLNLVFLNSSFTRDCGGLAEGCKAQADLHKEYAGGAHPYDVTADRPDANVDAQPGPADVGALGNLGTPSRFDGTGATLNQAGVQPVPRIMLSWNLDTFGLDGVALGAYVYAPSNGDFGFGADTPTRYTLVDRDMLELYYGIAAAYRYSHWIAVGASFQLVSAGLDQRIQLSADQYANEDPSYDILVHIAAYQHFIPSGNFGVWTNPGKALGIGDLELGGSVQLARGVKATGPITLEHFGDNLVSEFLDPDGDPATPGLVAFSADGATATAEFTLAPMYRVGARYGLDDVMGDGKNTLAFDVEADFVYEGWSVYDHVFLSTQGVVVDMNTGDDVAGEELDPVVQPKDWTDAWSARVGGTVALWDRMLELHGGGFYETSAIPSSTYSVELVCGDKVGVGLGLSGSIAGVRLDVGYSHVQVFDRVVGDESIVYSGTSGPSLLMGGADTKTRVAMGRYASAFDMVNVGLTWAIDQSFGYGAFAPSAKN